MYVKPANRNLLISIIEEEVEELETSTFLLPEDFKKKQIERYIIVRIDNISDDCEKTLQHHIGKRCVVEASMINEIKIDSHAYNIIGENYVVLFVEG